MTVDSDASHSPSTLGDADYHRLADGVIASIEACIDRWLQDDVVDIDSQRTGGMLEMTFPNGSKIIVNKQPPLHEIWLAARSGGYHYKPVDGAWIDSRAGKEFFQALSECASEQGGRPLVFEAWSLRAISQVPGKGDSQKPPDQRNRSRMLLRSSSVGAARGFSSRPTPLMPEFRVYSS